MTTSNSRSRSHANSTCILRFTQLLFIASMLIVSMSALAQQTVEQWKQHRVSISNTTWSGNPYDIVLTAEFTHSESGDIKTQFGFYAGNDTWKIYFMPDQIGDWTYTTNSADADLDDVSGSFSATPPSISGSIKPDAVHWRLHNGDVIFPTLLPVGPYVRSNSISQTQGLIDWAASVAGATYLGTTLLNFSGDGVFTDSQEDRMYIDGSGEGVDFYLPAWDRSNEFYDAVRDANMGHYIMIYSDDDSSPNLHGLPENSDNSVSNAEKRLFRYLLARFAPYPKVIWDSGIDIGENRSDAWINNYVAWFQANDPWMHPVSSRLKPGNRRGINPPAAVFISDGQRELPSRSELVEKVESRNKPTGMFDRYRENYPSPFDGGRSKIREANWQMILTYSTAVYFGGNENGGYLGSTYASDFEAAPDLGVSRQFLDNNVVDLEQLAPNDDLVSSGDAWVATDSATEYVVYSRSGSSLTLSMDLGNAEFRTYWYDPTTGDTTDDQTITGQGAFQFTKPGDNAIGEDDWVLHIVLADALIRPEAITDLVVQ